jgi:hypothetical protein
MRSLLDLDKTQLSRIEGAIATLVSLPATERARKNNLIRALESEKKELIRCNPAIRLATRSQAA